MLINKITPSITELWLKRLDTQLNKPTNQNLLKVPKVVRSTNKKTLGTSVINSLLSPLSLCIQPSPWMHLPRQRKNVERTKVELENKENWMKRI